MSILRVDIENPSRSSKSLIPASEVDSSDTVLAKHGRTHDAWLDGDIQVRLVEHTDGVLRQDAGDGNELGVPRAVQSAVRLVHASANDFAILHKDTADWCLVALECEFSLWHVTSQH